MAHDDSKRTWLAQLRRVFPVFGRERHFADVSADRQAAQKMTPIAKVMADAGRESTTRTD